MQCKHLQQMANFGDCSRASSYFSHLLTLPNPSRQNKWRVIWLAPENCPGSYLSWKDI